MVKATISIGRRTFLKTIAISTTGTLLAGCSSTGDSSKNDDSLATKEKQAFDGWFDNTANFDGIVDKTNTEEITVTVGAAGNNGLYAFAPPAIRIESGTTVTWKWTGKGGAHNVVVQEGTFQSKMTEAKGTVFEYLFKNTDVYKYFCEPTRQWG
ncbi:halocyanin domain-containing protein [Halocatena marina]|uniref:halocyanin domain-containing protein n=1 Tax=Halocatena marina TaxID=2934937 RepID=UPI00200F7F62|nr:halocyanin domain-containing protein [Halocatena marina]